MGVQIKTGDLMGATESIIGHQVNCQAVMGSGVAKQIRLFYPKAYSEYLRFCAANKDELLGKCQLVEVGNGTYRYIANLFGQEFYGGDGRKYTDDAALKKSLEHLYEFAKDKGYSAALPYKIGCDRGGGDWDQVSKLIENIFTDVELTLYKLE